VIPVLEVLMEDWEIKTQYLRNTPEFEKYLNKLKENSLKEAAARKAQ